MFAFAKATRDILGGVDGVHRNAERGCALLLVIRRHSRACYETVWFPGETWNMSRDLIWPD